MAISNVTLNTGIRNMTSAKVSTADNETKNLQNQLANKEQSLQRLSSDSKLTAEEKAIERQELQQQIAELNRKLKLLQMEAQEKAKETQKEQEQKAALNEELYGKTEEKASVDEEQAKEESAVTQEQDQEEVWQPVQELQQMLSVDFSLQQERVQASTARKQEGAVNVLEAELQSDKLYGIDNLTKKEELSDMRRQESLLIEVHEPQKSQAIIGMDVGTKIIIKE